MKTLLCLALVLFGFNAGAQSFRDWPGTVTNSVPGAFTNSAPATNVTAASSYWDLDTARAQKVLVELKANGPATAATNATVFTTRFSYSMDGTNFYTLPALVLPLTLSYSNVVTVHTNLDTSFFRYLRVATMENIAANHVTNAVTNIVLRTFFK